MNLYRMLGKLRACDESRRWAKDKTQQEAYAKCTNPGWLHWLVNAIGMPTDGVKAAALESLELFVKRVPMRSRCAEEIMSDIRRIRHGQLPLLLDHDTRFTREAANARSAYKVLRSYAQGEWFGAAVWMHMTGWYSRDGITGRTACRIIRKHVPLEEIRKYARLCIKGAR